MSKRTNYFGLSERIASALKRGDRSYDLKHFDMCYLRNAMEDFAALKAALKAALTAGERWLIADTKAYLPDDDGDVGREMRVAELRAAKEAFRVAVGEMREKILLQKSAETEKVSSLMGEVERLKAELATRASVLGEQKAVEKEAE